MGDLQLKLNDDLPLWNLVFETLREAILRGDLKPGERLMEMTLAAKLGVSRTPVREAIRMLELEGLAVTIPKRGARVAKMTERDMEDAMEIRRALDELAVKNVCERITKEETAELRLAQRAFERAIDDGDFIEIVKKDEAFHNVIYNATGNKKLVSLISSMLNQLYRYRVEYLKKLKSYDTLIEEHKAILAAMERGDVEAAVANTRKHVDGQQEIVKKAIRRQNV